MVLGDNERNGRHSPKLYFALFHARPAPSLDPLNNGERDEGAQSRAGGIRDDVADAWRAARHEGLMQFVGQRVQRRGHPCVQQRR